MQEQLISFETAKLAKEKGFNIVNYFPTWYNKNQEIEEIIISEPEFDWVQAPTQSLLQKWLRDVHGIHVQPQKTFHNKTYTIGKIPLEFRIPDYPDKNAWGKPISYRTGGQGKKFKTYEEALEVGLLVALDAIREKDE